jgi:hypothetical protein
MDSGEPGAIVLYEAADAFAHSDFIDQLLAEEQIEKWIAGKGNMVVWDRIRRKNHKLDSTYAATTAGEFIIVEAAKTEGSQKAGWFAQQKRKNGRSSRRSSQ